MNIKDLLESFKHSLQSEINDIISKDDYTDYSSQLTGNLKRIYYINKELENESCIPKLSSIIDIVRLIKERDLAVDICNCSIAECSINKQTIQRIKDIFGCGFFSKSDGFEKCLYRPNVTTEIKI